MISRVGKVDAVITDPPYGISHHNKRYKDLHPGNAPGVIAGDDSQELGQEMIDYFFQCGVPVLTFAHVDKPWRGPFRQKLFWHKGPAVGGGGDPCTTFKNCVELIQYGGFGPLNGKRGSNLLDFPITPQNMASHPHHKPLDLMLYLVEKFTKTGQRILDPFCGSGSTLQACQILGRESVGIEIDPHYAQICKEAIHFTERMKATSWQPNTNRPSTPLL